MRYASLLMHMQCFPAVVRRGWHNRKDWHTIRAALKVRLDVKFQTVAVLIMLLVVVILLAIVTKTAAAFIALKDKHNSNISEISLGAF